MNTDHLIAVATLGKPHGIKGAVSIHPKTRPGSLVFNVPLFLLNNETIEAFPISSFEEHHSKIVLSSPMIHDRTEAGFYTSTTLYAERDDFFTKFPEQVFDDMCHGYTVLNKEKQPIGTLDYIEDIREIPMGRIHNDEVTQNLPMIIESIDHSQRTLQLNYSPE